MNQQKNTYLEQVMQQKVEVDDALRVKRMPSPMSAPGGRGDSGKESGSGVRITGFWRFKNVIVPPNVYVVHTRRGRDEPRTIGLGRSFRFDPVTDAFLIVPAAMQTITLQANCICKERQGVVVQGYVQWIIKDIATAYKKLEFNDVEPMRVVIVQLREQAEAAIKDKVATMSIDEVLADKQPIIEELTARLRHVAEGDGASEGLGLRIVTVQIKEAVVCSPTVWEMLQRPFRAERGKEARLAELASRAVVEERENEAERETTRRRIDTEAIAAKQRDEARAAAFVREQADQVRRAQLEADAAAASAAHERAKIAHASELQKLRLEQAVMAKKLEVEARRIEAQHTLDVDREQRKIENDLAPIALQRELVRRLPEIAEKLPKPQELKTVHLSGSSDLAHMLAGIAQAATAFANGKE
jgi:hypothetical protein